jgi:UDP-3-O-[3-hydroxymyristoyl] glucosamine N-acyltransferase
MKRPRRPKPKDIIKRPPRIVRIGAGAVIHDTSILGFPNRDQKIFSNNRQRTVQIGAGCIIHAWCLIHEGASVGKNVEVHERCSIGSRTTIGANSLILYGAQVHDGVTIGQDCIIGGFVADNTMIGDGSSVFGTLIHKYKRPGRNDWDETDEPGPRLGKQVIVGWGAVVIGPIIIGDRARILPNTVVSQNVPAGSRYGTA